MAKKTTSKSSGAKKTTSRTTKKPTSRAKKPTVKKATAPKEETVKKTVVTAETAKENLSKPLGKRPAPKKPATSIISAVSQQKNTAINQEKINSFNAQAVRKQWMKVDLINLAKSMFGQHIKIEECNPRQISFSSGGVRIPSKGHYTVQP